MIKCNVKSSSCSGYPTVNYLALRSSVLSLQLHCFGSPYCHGVSFSHCRQLLLEQNVLNLKGLRNYRLEAVFKRWSLTAVYERFVMYMGRQFLEDGGSDALPPQVWSTGVMSKGWKWQIGKYKQEEVSEVGRGQVMEGFISKQQDFEVCSFQAGEPVQYLKDWGDMVMET